MLQYLIYTIYKNNAIKYNFYEDRFSIYFYISNMHSNLKLSHVLSNAFKYLKKFENMNRKENLFSKYILCIHYNLL